jgi:SET domain-containing protein
VDMGAWVGEYVGEIISGDEMRDRVKCWRTGSFIMAVEEDIFIDATKMGNYTRFLNHSCKPNCEAMVWTVRKSRRIGIFATRQILEGEELTISYNLVQHNNSTERIECLCGSDNCSGSINRTPPRRSKRGGTAH